MLAMKDAPDTLTNEYLYKLEPDKVLRIYALEHESDGIIQETHVGPVSGNFH